jgi:uncharacterized protein YgbK (DUF1537 family)
MRLGAIADDFTGASDLGNMLARAGMSTTLCFGTPDEAASGTEAVVVALKTRSIPADDAVSQSLDALNWLRSQRCDQVYFKYCSTFDSTPAGNIGPVLEALARALGAPRAVVVPSFPEAGRRVFMGHLFVNDQLLSRSGMEHHPLTPMTEPDLRIWLGKQTDLPVAHVDVRVLRQGHDAIRAQLDALQRDAESPVLVVMDTVDEDDLRAIGRAVAKDVLVSGGSGLGLGLPENFDGLDPALATAWTARGGRAVALAGSCSAMTRRQVAAHEEGHPVLRLDPIAIAEGRHTPRDAADWVIAQDPASVPLVSSAMAPDDLARVQSLLGREESASLIEGFFGDVARSLVAQGFERIVTGGGETSGAIVSALGLRKCRIGPQIAPGVPALAPEGEDFVCTLKSGNFGDAGFFAHAANVLGVPA